MAFKLIWSPTAKFDLKNIAAFISEDSTLAAERFVRSLFQAVERLTDFPESGRIVPEFNDPAIREVIRKPCTKKSKGNHKYLISDNRGGLGGFARGRKYFSRRAAENAEIETISGINQDGTFGGQFI